MKNSVNPNKHILLQEYNPDLTHNISKKERPKKDGVLLTNVMAAVDHCPGGDQHRYTDGFMVQLLDF